MVNKPSSEITLVIRDRCLFYVSCFESLERRLVFVLHTCVPFCINAFFLSFQLLRCQFVNIFDMVILIFAHHCRI